MRALSSVGMTTLISWRNPRGANDSYLAFTSRCLISEVGFVAFGLFAVAESALHASLSLESIRRYATHETQTHALKWLSSSLFVVAWSVSCLVQNLLFGRLAPHEIEARIKVDNHMPLNFFTWYFAQEELDIHGAEQAPAEPIEPAGIPINDYLNVLYETNSRDMQEDIINAEGTLRLWAATKLVFDYTVGDRRNDHLPADLLHETRNAIRNRRVNYANTTPEQRDAFNVNVNANLSGTPLLVDLNEISQAAQLELNNPNFTTPYEAWANALPEELPPPDYHTPGEENFEEEDPPPAYVAPTGTDG